MFADVGEIAFAPDADVCFGEFEARDVIIAVTFVPQAVGFVVNILLHRYASLSRSVKGESSDTKVS